MLNPMIPSEVSVKPVPYQRLPSFFGLFRIKQFNGLALTAYLHAVAQIVNIVMSIIFILASFAAGIGPGIAGLVFFSIMVIINAAIIRIVAELIISVLLIPSLVAKNQSGGTVAGEIGMEDLHAYGVSDTDRMTSSAI